MLFHSIQFFVPFLAVLFIYYVIPKKLQWPYLLIVSFAFYMYQNPRYTIFLILSICTTFVTGLIVSDSRSTKTTAKLCMAVSAALNIGMLLFFKYSQMLLGTLEHMAHAFGYPESIFPHLDLVAPIGISFYTFKVIGYLMDLYHGKIHPEKNIGKYALYVSFFPQIVSGPIERSYDFLPQLAKGHSFDYDTVKDGLLYFLLGLLKKIVIADRLALLTDQVFQNIYSYGTPAYLIAVFSFTMQIYFDFSGYSDMAVGCAKMLGIHTIKNFDRPYFASTIADFWHRWHISLSTWFRDYLYIPLGGSRVAPPRWIFNIMTVFLISGMWHGSSWTFVIWGGIHGIYQVAGRLTRQKRDALLNKLHIQKSSGYYKFFSQFFTFILVAYAWMFFRANTIQDALHMTKSLIFWNWNGFDLLNLGMNAYDLVFSVIILAVWFLIEALQSETDLLTRLQTQILPIRWGVYLAILFTCILFGIYGDLSSSSFIYFQF